MRVAPTSVSLPSRRTTTTRDAQTWWKTPSLLSSAETTFEVVSETHPPRPSRLWVSVLPRLDSTTFSQDGTLLHRNMVDYFTGLIPRVLTFEDLGCRSFGLGTGSSTYPPTREGRVTVETVGGTDPFYLTRILPESKEKGKKGRKGR